MAEHHFTASDHDRRAAIAPGDAVAVALSENPTTGYRWHVVSAGALEPVDDDFEPAGTAPGAGGTRRFRWRVAAAGANRVELVLAPAWDPGGDVAGRFSLTVEAA